MPPAGTCRTSAARPGAPPGMAAGAGCWGSFTGASLRLTHVATALPGSALSAPRPARPGLVLLHQLDQGAERRLGVDKGDSRAATARARRLVDDPVATGLHPLERLTAVGDAVSDVVETFALLREV